MTDQIKKLDLTSNVNLPLQLFFFLVQNGNMVVNVPVALHVAVAYTENDAVNILKQEYPMGAVLSIDKKGSIPVEKMLDTINIPIVGHEPLAQTMPIEVPVKVKKVSSVDQFVNGLLLVANSYIKNKADKRELIRIISTIKTHD